MGSTIKTSRMSVESVGRTHVVVRDRDGQTQSVSWDTLRAASRQDDAKLSGFYGRLLRTAEAMAADGPVVVSVHKNETNVWWVVTVTAVHGLGVANWRRLADEGGTHAGWRTAIGEAKDICERLGARVIERQGC